MPYVTLDQALTDSAAFRSLSWNAGNLLLRLICYPTVKSFGMLRASPGGLEDDFDGALERDAIIECLDEQRHPEHRIYPYLLRDLSITRPNQVWCADVTYIPLRQGFLYLVAVMDWATRKVLAWRLSNTMDASFCVEALEEALALNGSPEIFNTDQGSQFTSLAFTEALQREGVKISMDGKGQWRDNVFIERLWRSLKYEEVYLHDYETGTGARQGVGRYFRFYNQDRPHSSLDDRTPDEAYAGLCGPQPPKAA